MRPHAAENIPSSIGGGSGQKPLSVRKARVTMSIRSIELSSHVSVLIFRHWSRKSIRLKGTIIVKQMLMNHTHELHGNNLTYHMGTSDLSQKQQRLVSNLLRLSMVKYPNTGL